MIQFLFPYEITLNLKIHRSTNRLAAKMEEVVLNVKWQKRRFTVELGPDETVADLRARLYSLTDVLPKHQKLFGLPGVGMLEDATLGTLKLRPEHNVMLMGTPCARLALMEEERVRALGAFSVVDDLDWDGGGGVEDVAASRRRLERRIAHTNINLIHAPRDGKRLLVLDLDFTLFDCKSEAPTVAELGRPGLHAFLAAAYEHYDICVWSQTSWRWLEAKITELAMLTAPDYRICFVLDRTSMFSVTSVRGKRRKKHEVKALELIWRKFPGRWSKSNTIHIDDLRRNFVMNPQSGLRISAYRNALVARAHDRELFVLQNYLSQIAQREPDFSILDHSRWKDYCKMYGGSSSTNGLTSISPTFNLSSSVDHGLATDGEPAVDDAFAHNATSADSGSSSPGESSIDNAPDASQRPAIDVASEADGVPSSGNGESAIDAEAAADSETAVTSGSAADGGLGVDGGSPTDRGSSTNRGSTHKR